MTSSRRTAWTLVLSAALLAGGAGLSPAAAPQAAESVKIDASGFIDVGPDKIFYEAAGQGPAIVLIHDGNIHREIWDGQMAFLSKSHRVVRYDRRTYGKSSAATVPFSNVDDLNALFTHLKIDKAVLMGMSAGGGLAADFALAYPQKVTGLVLIGAVAGGFPYTPHMMTRGGHMPKFDFSDLKSLEKMRIWFALHDPYTIFPENSAAKEKAKRLVQQNPRKISNLRDNAPPPAVPAYKRLGEIKVPTLVLVGEADIPDCHAHAGVLAAGIPNARREVVSKAGHLLPLEQPEEFNKLAGEFLAGMKW